MSASSIEIVLLMGPVLPVPVPENVSMALSQVTVTRKGEQGSGCQLVFNTAKSASGLSFEVLTTYFTLPYNRVIVMVVIGLVPKVLFDGFITGTELATNEGEQGAKLTVTCEDVTVKMGMVESPASYPQFPDIGKIYAMLARYLVLGVVPLAIPPVVDVPDIDTDDQQMTSDLDQIRGLAKRAGYVFYVMPGPLPGANIAYWGPQHRIFPPQPPLSANVGPESNVESINASHNALGPTINWGSKLLAKVPIPFVNILAYTRLPPFALEGLLRSAFIPLGLAPETFPLVLPILPVKVRHLLGAGDDLVKALKRAQATTDLSADDTATLSGELDTTRYGSVLVAPGIVGVRGVGLEFDGFYYVQEVTHTINLDYGQMNYKQSFTLTREGMGTTTPVVFGLTTPGI